MTQPMATDLLGSQIDAIAIQIDARRTDVTRLVMARTDNAISASCSRPFRVVANDGLKYWVKCSSGQQSPWCNVMEQIVGRCGRLIDAPVCSVETIMIRERFVIPDAMRDDDIYCPEFTVEPSVAHASLDIPGVIESRDPLQICEIANCDRMSKLLVLTAWLLGCANCQWLIETTTRRLWSHDHSEWKVFNRLRDEEFVRKQYGPYRYVRLPTNDGSCRMVDVDVLVETADRLRDDVTLSQLVEIMSGIPRSWDVPSYELARLAVLYDARRATTAAHLVDSVAAQ